MGGRKRSKAMNKKIWIWMFLGVPGALIFLVLGVFDIIAGIADKDVRLLGLSSGICCLMSAFWIFSSFMNFVDKKLKTEEAKPVVQIWSHNGETIVTSDEVYRLSLSLRDHLLIVYPWISPSLRVRPLVYSIQSERRVGTITAEQLRVIKDSCSVSVSEMQIPNEGNIGHMVDFGQMWELLHGADAELPKV